MLTAKDIMTKEVITVKKELTVIELAKLLFEKGISGVPVVDDEGNVIGVVCESDLIDQEKNLHMPTVISLLDSFILIDGKSFDRQLKKMTGNTVGDIYTGKIYSVNPDTLVSEIATVMSEKRFYTIPVLEKGKLAGIIGKRDLLKSIIKTV